jgi:DNA-binding response OmpR family regulator
MQLSLHPREVRLVGLIQLESATAAVLPVPSLPQIDLVWRRQGVEEVNNSLDLVFVEADMARRRAILNTVSRVREKGFEKGLVLRLDRGQVSSAHKYVAAGVTDFVFSDAAEEEATCRLHAALLRNSPLRPVRGEADGLLLDWKHRAVVLGQQRVELTLRELQMLDAMIRAGVPLSPDALAREAWGNTSSHAGGLASAHVCNVRKKLARFGNAFGIRTHRGRGYTAELAQR